MSGEVREVVVVGSGPAGLTAAVYLARAALAPVVVAGAEAGGQLMLTSEVENYPGFPAGVLGPELMARMREQAERFGAAFLDEDAAALGLGARPFALRTASGAELRARAVVLATGAAALWLGLASEARLRGRGVSSCATCDGFFFRGKAVAVVGGGDTALEEATFLTRFARAVTVVHRRGELRASKALQARAFADPKIAFLWHQEVAEVLGAERVEGVRLRDARDGAERVLAADGLFVAIGYRPNTGLVRGQLELDAAGYVVPLAGSETRTGVPGVFVAGDAADPHYRQAVTAAGAGCKAALDAERYLATLPRT